jgi:hypothetical protein
MTKKKKSQHKMLRIRIKKKQPEQKRYSTSVDTKLMPTKTGESKLHSWVDETGMEELRAQMCGRTQ